jgi:hypothetical protein
LVLVVLLQPSLQLAPISLDDQSQLHELAVQPFSRVGHQFATRYVAAGGRIATDPRARLYWYLIDALHYSPDAEKLVVPWREAGRTDLTPDVVSERLESYVCGLMSSLSI